VVAFRSGLIRATSEPPGIFCLESSYISKSIFYMTGRREGEGAGGGGGEMRGSYSTRPARCSLAERGLIYEKIVYFILGGEPTSHDRVIAT